MFNLGLPEITIIALLALFLVAPKDIPKLMHSVGKLFQRLSYIRYAFSKQFEDFMKEAELKELQDKAENRSDEHNQDG